MAKVRQILKGVQIQVAGGRRRCYHSRKHSIERGEICLAVKEPRWGSWQSYCPQCGAAILAVAENDLEQLKAGLGMLSAIDRPAAGAVWAGGPRGLGG